MDMVYALNEDHGHHQEPGHPECPERLEAIQRGIEALPLRRIEGSPATNSELLLVHPQTYLHQVETTCQRPAHLDPDTYCTPRSTAVARSATGNLLAITQAVLTGNASAGYALIRPPGHHATPTHAMGFCLFNNIAIAVRYAQQKGWVRRVAIVDFDVHHGNGTQDVFYEDPHVLFISSHQYPLYPGTGRAEETGRGPGKGTTLNIPLPAGTSDEAFLQVYREVVGPVIERFAPDALFISAGYDAHWRDPLAQMHLSATGFYHVVTYLHTLGKKITGKGPVLTLEGGYDLDALRTSVRATFAALSGGKFPFTDDLGPSPYSDVSDLSPLITHLKTLHQVR